MFIAAPPNFRRQGVIAGFVLSPAAGLAPAITRGVLFAQGQMFRPSAAPALPAAPAHALSWLHYNSGTGFYWGGQAPNAADDASIGWVRTDAANVHTVSAQQILVEDEGASGSTVLPLGAVLPQQPAPSGGGIALPNVTLLAPQGPFYSLPDAQGQVFVEYWIPYAMPADPGEVDRFRVFLQDPDDAAPRANVTAGVVIPPSVTFTADPATDQLTLSSSPFPEGTLVTPLTTGTLPAPLSATGQYYIVQAAGLTVRLALTAGGAAIDLTTAGAGVHSLIPASASRLTGVGQLIDKNFYPHNPAETVLKISHPAPSARRPWRFYVASASPTYENKVVRADQPNPTPNVLVFVDPPPAGVGGEEFAPNADTFSLVPGFGPLYVDPQDGGDQLWAYAVQWTNKTWHPLYPMLGGYDLIFEHHGGQRVLNQSVGRDDNGRRADGGTFSVDSVPREFTLWLVPWDIFGRRNSIVPGVTRSVKINVAPQRGAGGQEFAALGTGFAVTANNYGVNGEGQKVNHIDFRIDPPAGDPKFGGFLFYMIRAGVHYQLSGLEPGGAFTFRYDLAHFPSANEDVTVYALSVDTNNRANTYVPGVTPALGITLTPPALGTPGKEYTQNVTPGASFITVSNVTTDDGSTLIKAVTDWTAPANDPTFGGVEIWARRPDLSFIFFGSERVPGAAHYSKPPAAIESWDFFTVARDVNGRRNTIVDGVTPKQTVVVNPQGLSLGKVTGGFNTTDFEMVGSVFTVKNIRSERIEVGSTLKVGGGGSKPGQLGVFDAVGNLIAWAGQQGSDYGIWGKQGGFGGTSLATAKIKMDSSGNVVIDGATFGLTLNNIRTSIENIFDGSFGEFVGVKVRDQINAGFSAMTIRGVRGVHANDSTTLFELSRLGSGATAAGSLALNMADASTFAELTAVSARMRITQSGNQVDVTPTFLSFGGLIVLRGRQAAVADPAGGSVVDVECRAQLVALLNTLRPAGHGLIA